MEKKIESESKQMKNEYLESEYCSLLRVFYYSKDYINFIKIFKEYEKLGGIDNISSVVLYEYATILQVLRKRREAIDIIKLLINRNNKNTYKYFRELGILYLSLHRSQEAEDSFKKAVYYCDDKDEKQKSLYFLGRLYIKMLNYTAAIDTFNKCLALNKNNIVALSMLGSIYKAMKQYDMALMYYEKALSYNEEDIKTLTSIGEIYLSMGNIKPATSYLNRAIKLNSQKKDYYFPCYLAAASLYIKSRNYLKAREMIDAVLKNSTYKNDITKAKILLGDICCITKNFSGALKYYQECIKDNPSYSVTYFKMGDLYTLLNREIDAKEAYEIGTEIETRLIRFFLNSQRELTLTLPNNN